MSDRRMSAGVAALLAFSALLAEGRPARAQAEFVEMLWKVPDGANAIALVRAEEFLNAADRPPRGLARAGGVGARAAGGGLAGGPPRAVRLADRLRQRLRPALAARPGRAEGPGPAAGDRRRRRRQRRRRQRPAADLVAPEPLLRAVQARPRRHRRAGRSPGRRPVGQRRQQADRAGRLRVPPGRRPLDAGRRGPVQDGDRPGRPLLGQATAAPRGPRRGRRPEDRRHRRDRRVAGEHPGPDDRDHRRHRDPRPAPGRLRQVDRPAEADRQAAPAGGPGEPRRRRHGDPPRLEHPRRGPGDQLPRPAHHPRRPPDRQPRRAAVGRRRRQ